MKKNILLSVTIISLMIYLRLINQGEAMEFKPSEYSPLQIKIETKKNEYSIGEDLEIKYIVKNISKENIIFVNWDKGYKTNWIKVYDANLNEMGWERQIIYELKRYLEKEKFIIIRPNAEYVLWITGGIKWDIKGKKILIDFKDSVVILNDIGDYVLRGAYESLLLWRKEAEKLYGMHNLWVGRTESLPLRITIK